MTDEQSSIHRVGHCVFYALGCRSAERSTVAGIVEYQRSAGRGLRRLTGNRRSGLPQVGQRSTTGPQSTR